MLGVDDRKSRFEVLWGIYLGDYVDFHLLLAYKM